MAGEKEKAGRSWIQEIQMALIATMREEVRELTIDTVELLNKTNKVEKE